MKRTLLKALHSATILWGVATLLFLLFGLAGDPVKMMLGPRADPATEDAVRKKIGYDKPVVQRYFVYLAGLSPIRKENEKWGVYPPNLGLSFRFDRPVWDLYLEKLPGTLILAVLALALGAAAGIALGVAAAMHENRPLDQIIAVVASLGFSVPSYFAAVLGIWLFTVVFDVGLRPTGYVVEDKIFGEGTALNLRSLVLPVLTLAVRPLGTITLITRERMSDILKKPYVLAARAQGVSERRVLWVLALKNAAVPLVGSLSGWLAALLTGAFFIEFLFDWQGVGRLMVEGLLNNDFPLVSGCCLATATLFIAINAVTDRIYRWADPAQRND